MARKRKHKPRKRSHKRGSSRAPGVAIVRVNSGPPAHKRKHKRRRGGGGFSLGGGILALPPKSDLMDMGAGYVYGKAEEWLKSNSDSVVLQGPMIDAIGMAGNFALRLHVLGKLFRLPPAHRHLVKAAGTIATYGMAVKGGTFSKATDTLSGLRIMNGEDHQTRHLAEEEIDGLAGIPFDAEVADAGAHT